MLKMHETTKARWINAAAMAASSLKPTLSGQVARNFVSGKLPAHPQFLDLIAAVEGYTLNCWATTKQVAQLGGTVREGAPKFPVWSTRNGKTTCYYVVNFDECTLPDLDTKAYNTAIAAIDNIDTYEYVPFAKPTPLPVKAKKVDMHKTIERQTEERVAAKRNLKDSVHKKLDTTPQQAGAAVQLNNRASDYAKSAVAEKPSMFHLELKEFGIRVEAPTMYDAQILLEKAVDAYIKCKQA